MTPPTRLRFYVWLVEWDIFRHDCRGGYYPPAQNKVKLQEMFGEFAPISHIDTILPNTQFHYPSGRLIASPTVGWVVASPFYHASHC